MMLEEAIEKACYDAGIQPPKWRSYGKWLKADTLSGKNGKGDGRLIINDRAVTAHNWQTGISVTVSLKDGVSAQQRQEIRRKSEKARANSERDALNAARIATALTGAATLAVHPYFERKGFPEETALTISAHRLRAIVHEFEPKKSPEYLIAGETAIVMPARIGPVIKSVQLIWEDGTKKFLFGGAVSGASHRICSGRAFWYCEGYATGLSLRKAFRAMNYSATVSCCFSSSNIGQVAAFALSRAYIAADNDKPIPQYDGKGAGEFFAAKSGKPFVMPPTVGDDFNDMEQRDGIFAVQRLLTSFLRETSM